MAWFAAIGAAASLLQAKQSSDAAATSAVVRGYAADSTNEQTLNAEADQRRQGREFLGRQAAAIAQSGTGPGGSNERIQNESAINAELDALNIRYKGAMTAWGYRVDQANLQSQSKSDLVAGGLNAGAKLLKGYADYKTA